MSITAQAPSSNLEAREGETITLRISPSPDSSFERSFQNEKFTVGSSARCDLQLTQPGVQPLHCVFVRKPAAVQVTSWAAGVVLNDNPFQTATFNPGDVIRVGAVQIAWVNQKNEFDEENNDPTGSLEIAPEFSGEPEEDNVDWGVTPTSESEAATYQASTQADPRQAERSAFSDWLVYQTTVGRETSRSRCKQLMKTCRDSREVASGLADQIEQLEKRLAEASQERLTLQAESDQLAAQSTEDSQRRLGQVEELENQLTSLREELESTRQELAVQSKLQEDAQAAQEQLQLERDELATAVNDQSLSEEGVSELLAERDRQLEEVRTELANARDALAGAEEQLNTQTERFDLLETELKERNEEIARLTDQLAAAENNQEAGELGERCDLLQTALDAAEKRISDLSQLNLERSGELEQLRLASETWTQEKAEWQQEQSASQETLAALREQVESAQGRDEEEISDLKAERDQLRDELETAKSALEEFGDSESQRGAQLANWEEQQGEWQAEKSRLESELSEKSKAVLELKNDLEAKEKIDGSANEELTEERDRLATELAAANESLLELRDASAAQQKELEALVQQTNDASQVENTAVNEEQLAELTARLESLAIELQETRTRCDEAEARAEQLQILLDQATEQLRNLEAERGTPGSLASDESLETNRLEEVGGTFPEEIKSVSADQPAQLSSEPEAPSENEDSVEKEDFFAAKPQPKSEGGPASTSFIEQYSHLLEEDGLTQPEPVVERENPLAAEHSPAETVPGDEDEDEALQAYMANMMSRVRGDGPLASPATPAPVKPTPVEKKQEAAQEEEYAPPVDPIGLDELRQTTKKAPLTSDLAALRDLANTSARTAIAKSSKRRHFELAISKLIICGISLPTAGYLMYAAKSFTGVMFLGGAVAAVAGLYSGVQLLGCLLRAIRDGSWEGAEGASTGAGADVELPIAGEEPQRA